MSKLIITILVSLALFTSMTIVYTSHAQQHMSPIAEQINSPISDLVYSDTPIPITEASQSSILLGSH